jgi:hypothetical protein
LAQQSARQTAEGKLLQTFRRCVDLGVARGRKKNSRYELRVTPWTVYDALARRKTTAD